MPRISGESDGGDNPKKERLEDPSGGRGHGLAEKSPGFVWRYVSDSRDPDAREYDDVMVLFNMSVWRDIDALHNFTYRTAHAELFANRKKWKLLGN